MDVMSKHTHAKHIACSSFRSGMCVDPFPLSMMPYPDPNIFISPIYSPVAKPLLHIVCLFLCQEGGAWSGACSASTGSVARIDLAVNIAESWNRQEGDLLGSPTRFHNSPCSRSRGLYCMPSVHYAPCMEPINITTVVGLNKKSSYDHS